MTKDVKVFKTIKLGTGLMTADDFCQAFKRAGYRIGDWANALLSERAFQTASQATEVDLVIVSVADLGFPKGANGRDIYPKAQELGLMLCSPEVGPQLRLQYTDQPNGECLFISSDGDLDVFYVERDDSGSWLHGKDGCPDCFWDGGDCWVFLRPTLGIRPT